MNRNKKYSGKPTWRKAENKMEDNTVVNFIWDSVMQGSFCIVHLGPACWRALILPMFNFVFYYQLWVKGVILRAFSLLLIRRRFALSFNTPFTMGLAPERIFWGRNPSVSNRIRANSQLLTRLHEQRCWFVSLLRFIFLVNNIEWYILADLWMMNEMAVRYCSTFCKSHYYGAGRC